MVVSFQVLPGEVFPYFWAHMLVDPDMQEEGKQLFLLQEGNGANWNVLFSCSLESRYSSFHSES